MMPISLFIACLFILLVLGVMIVYKSVFLPHTKLVKADVYLRAIFCGFSLFLSLATTTGVYIGEPTVDSLNSTTTTTVYSFMPAIEWFWVVPLFLITFLSFFATCYAWLYVFIISDKEVK